MGSFFQLMVAISAVLAIFYAEPGVTRSLNINSSWLLPQYDFPVFYRHFRDRVTWFEADAVCQFHHAQLATVESNNQFEAIRSYLKELDVTENVWIGLKRNNEASEFTWTNYQPLARGGYFREEVPRSSDPVCVVTDPTANFKWHSLHCGGPEVASFVCELPVPYWASKSNGCMTSMMEGMTVTFLPERPAIQLTKECGPGISTNVTCNGNMEPYDINEKLSCANANRQQVMYSKSVRPILPDIMFKTTTSSSESDVEDYAIEMATIAQYNDETFQSISKVMGRGGNGGMVNLPQEMSIALEPIKSSSGRSFDTNGIDSAFMNAMMADTTSSTTMVTPSTTTTTITTTNAPSTTTTTGTPSTTTTTGPPSTTSTVTPSTSTTGAPNTVAATTMANKKTEHAETTAAATTTAATKQPVPSTTTIHSTSTTRTTRTKITTTGSTETDSTTEVPMKPTLKPRTPVYATVTRLPPTNRPIVYGTPVTTTVGRRRPIVATPNNDPAATTTTEHTPVTPSPTDAPMTTTEKIRTIAKILNQAGAGDNPGPVTDATPIIASLASLATTLANQIASTGRPPVTGGFADALHSLLRGDDQDVPTLAATLAARETTTTAGVTPKRVYKKIDLQPIMPDFETEMPGHNRKNPDYFPYYQHPAKATSPAETITSASGQTNGTTATTAATTVTTQPITIARPTTAVSTQTAAGSTTTAGVITAAANVSANDNSWNPLTPPSTPLSDLQTAEAAVFDASTSASADVSTTATAATTAAATGTNAASTFTTTNIASNANVGTTATTAAATTAAVNNRRKVNNYYDAYTEHPNRNRHIVRPKQQHHHSYPYILYRLLG